MSVLVVARGKDLIGRIVPLINAGGVTARGTTEEDDAVSWIETGDISTLIIGGGVEPASRQRLRASANLKGVRVIDGRAHGKDPRIFVREELLPELTRR
jgi:hypothetical protein